MIFYGVMIIPDFLNFEKISQTLIFYVIELRNVSSSILYMNENIVIY